MNSPQDIIDRYTAAQQAAATGSQADRDAAFRAKFNDAAARAKAAQAKPAHEAAGDHHMSEFARRCPAAAAWIARTMGTFEFARAMHDAVRKYGDLTPRQAEAVAKCIAREAERNARQTEPRVAVDTAPIEAAFEAARKAGVRVPLRLDTFVFSAAPANGRNAGGIYVKRADDQTYLGKIMGGRFERRLECSPVEATAIAEAAADPYNAAIAYGRKYSRCSVCNAALSDPKSVARGIGPVCAAKFGW